MQTSPEREQAAVLAAFLRQFVSDRAEGRALSLAHYQALFPGFEEAIAREYEGLRDRDGTAVPWIDDAAHQEGENLGAYRLLRVLGRGGQGEVWLAEDSRLKRKVALKVLRGLGSAPEGVLRRFRREAEVASRLDHPGICAVYDTGVEGGLAWIAMRYVEGESLAFRLAALRSGRVSESATHAEPSSTHTRSGPTTRPDVFRAARLIEQAARAVHAAHEAGVVHRDLKPGNIMVTPEGDPVILDFGLAKEVAHDGSALTLTGDMFGTPAYMSPEQISTPAHALDRRTDVWSLGVVLFECLTHRRPFEGATREALYRSILSEEPPSARKLQPLIPPDLNVAVLTALEKDLRRRYQTALDFAEDLRRALALEPIRARPLGPLARLHRWMRRKPAKAAAIALVVAVAGLGGFLAVKWPELRAQAEQRRREAAERALEEGFLTLEERPEQSLESFRRAMEALPESLEATGGAALALIRLHRPLEAIAFLDRHTAMETVEPALAWVRVDALREAGRTEESNALESRLGRPQDPMSCFLLAVLEMNRGYRGEMRAFQRAVDLLDRCVIESPHARPLFYYSLAMAAGLDRNKPLALKTTAAIFRLWGESFSTVFSSGVALIYADPPRAVEYLQKARQLRPDDPIIVTRLGEALAESGERESAIRILREALGMRPDHPHTLEMLGVALGETGDLDGAIEVLAKAVEVQPDHPANRFNLGYTLHRKGDLRGAVSAYEEAIRLLPEFAEARTNLGCVLRDLGELDRALVELKEAERLQPDKPSTLINLSYVHLGRGEVNEAINALQKFLRIEPEHPGALVNLGSAYRRMGQPDNAVPVFREAVRLQPDFTEARGHLALALRESGRFQEALAEMRGLKEDDIHRLRWEPDVVARDLEELERMAAVEPALERLLAGELSIAEVGRPDLVARVAGTRKRFALATRLWESAFEIEGGLAPDLASGDRYRAACAAAQAAAGDGEDAKGLGLDARARYGAKAVEWLEADLELWRSEAQTGLTRARRARETLKQWRAAPELKNLHEEAALAQLPAAVRDRCRALWTSVDEALAAIE